MTKSQKLKLEHQAQGVELAINSQWINLFDGQKHAMLILAKDLRKQAKEVD